MPPFFVFFSFLRLLANLILNFFRCIAPPFPASPREAATPFSQPLHHFSSRPNKFATQLCAVFFCRFRCLGLGLGCLPQPSAFSMWAAFVLCAFNLQPAPSTGSPSVRQLPPLATRSPLIHHPLQRCRHPQLVYIFLKNKFLIAIRRAKAAADYSPNNLASRVQQHKPKREEGAFPNTGRKYWKNIYDLIYG